MLSSLNVGFVLRDGFRCLSLTAIKRIIIIKGKSANKENSGMEGVGVEFGEADAEVSGMVNVCVSLQPLSCSMVKYHPEPIGVPPVGGL